MNHISLREWISEFNSGKYSKSDIDSQIDAGWFDWFCRDTSLCGKTKALGPKVLQIAKSSKVNLDAMYVFFKNNCPMVGKLYDDIRICSLETHSVLWTITPKSGHSLKAEVWGHENDFREALYVGDWKGVREFFGV